MSYLRFAEISHSLAPGRVAAVMGTGVLALTTRSLVAHWSWLSLPAGVLRGTIFQPHP